MSSTKVVALDRVADRVNELRRTGKRIVATNGCFDLLHVGHVRYLKQARGLGDVLVVGLNGDESVRALKGVGRPLNPVADRAEVLAALTAVDVVTVFAEPRATAFIEAVRPDVYVKGGDYTRESLNSDERAALEKIGAKIEIVSFEQGYSTSELLMRLQRGK